VVGILRRLKMPKIFFQKSVKYRGVFHAPNVPFEVGQGDVESLRKSGGFLIDANGIGQDGAGKVVKLNTPAKKAPQASAPKAEAPKTDEKEEANILDGFKGKK
jgi:hypothetical protein